MPQVQEMLQVQEVQWVQEVQEMLQVQEVQWVQEVRGVQEVQEALEVQEVQVVTWSGGVRGPGTARCWPASWEARRASGRTSAILGPAHHPHLSTSAILR